MNILKTDDEKFLLITKDEYTIYAQRLPSSSAIKSPLSPKEQIIVALAEEVERLNKELENRV